jgi:ABC-2 type transport system permease protein
MKEISATVLNEIAKLLSRKKYQALLLLTCLLSMATGLLGGFTKGLIGLSSTNMPLTVLSIATGFLIPLMIAMAAADVFTAEQENGSIRAVLTRPVSRISIFTSKVLAIVLYTILTLLVCFVTSLVWSIVFNAIGLSNITEALLGYTVSIVPMLPIILFAVAISQLCKNSSSTVMMSVFCYILIVTVCTVLPSISPMLFTSYTHWYNLFIGAAMPIANILNVLALLMAYTLIFFAVSLWAFEKKEY